VNQFVQDLKPRQGTALLEEERFFSLSRAQRGIIGAPAPS